MVIIVSQERLNSETYRIDTQVTNGHAFPTGSIDRLRSTNTQIHDPNVNPTHRSRHKHYLCLLQIAFHHFMVLIYKGCSPSGNGTHACSRFERKGGTRFLNQKVHQINLPRQGGQIGGRAAFGIHLIDNLLVTATLLDEFFQQVAIAVFDGRVQIEFALIFNGQNGILELFGNR